MQYVGIPYVLEHVSKAARPLSIRDLQLRTPTIPAEELAIACDILVLRGWLARSGNDYAPSPRLRSRFPAKPRRPGGLTTFIPLKRLAAMLALLGASLATSGCSMVLIPQLLASLPQAKTQSDTNVPSYHPDGYRPMRIEQVETASGKRVFQPCGNDCPAPTPKVIASARPSSASPAEATPSVQLPSPPAAVVATPEEIGARLPPLPQPIAPLTDAATPSGSLRTAAPADEGLVAILLKQIDILNARLRIVEDVLMRVDTTDVLLDVPAAPAMLKPVANTPETPEPPPYRAQVASQTAATGNPPPETRSDPRPPESVPSRTTQTVESVVNAGDERSDPALWVRDWIRDWTSKDLPSLLARYDESFRPADGSTKQAWLDRRRNVLSRPGEIAIRTDIVNVRTGESEAEVRFWQDYQSPYFKSRVLKAVRLVLRDGAWRIQREQVLEPTRTTTI